MLLYSSHISLFKVIVNSEDELDRPKREKKGGKVASRDGCNRVVGTDDLTGPTDDAGVDVHGNGLAPLDRQDVYGTDVDARAAAIAHLAIDYDFDQPYDLLHHFVTTRLTDVPRWSSNAPSGVITRRPKSTTRSRMMG